MVVICVIVVVMLLLVEGCASLLEGCASLLLLGGVGVLLSGSWLIFAVDSFNFARASSTVAIALVYSFMTICVLARRKDALTFLPTNRQQYRKERRKDNGQKKNE